MDQTLVICLAIGAGLVLLRLFAARRVHAGQGSFVWLLFLPTLLPGVALIVGGVTLLESDPLLGFAFIALGLVFVAALAWFLTRASRAVGTTPAGGDAVGAMTEPMADLMTVWVVVPLAFGVIAVVALIVWGVVFAGR